LDHPLNWATGQAGTQGLYRWHPREASPRLGGMKLPLLFRRDRTILKRPDAQDQVEKLLAESLRALGVVCSKVADLIETQRLSRQGYSQQQDFLRRVDQEKAQGPEKK
jgi:hypothetical protein